ncbi:MAG: quinolinate synthase NadA [Armatimonadota bacterium]|nr:quinolinate synthase NadA [Armatimonadota bacterium]
MTVTDIEQRVAELKQMRNAVILVHNYQIPEVQDLGDYLGDSLGLSQEAAETDADVIVFCGVHFMAQTAKLLSPEKTVLMPDPGAGCPMADMITPEQVRKFKAEHDGAPVVAYVNTTAEVKAESDICCTSSNSIRVVESLDADPVLFIPDAHLADWTDRNVSKQVIAWGGYCPTHVRISPETVRYMKQQHPDAVFIVHPEARREVVDLADEVASTGGMVTFARESDADEIIVGTEEGLVYRLRKENPDKTFYVVPHTVCPNMKKTTAEKLVALLEEMQYEIDVAPDIAERAREAVARMMAVS